MFEIKLCAICGRYRCDVKHEDGKNKPDVILSTGRVIEHYPMTNGATDANPADGGPMSEPEWREYSGIVTAARERSCSDCESYAPLALMTTKADGRVICPKCNEKARKLTAERAQMTMFGQQSLI